MSFTVNAETLSGSDEKIQKNGNAVSSTVYGNMTVLKENYGFNKVVAFGDNLNDLPLFEASDEAYAVENAKEDVKKHATAVIGRNTEDAVAKYLAKVSEKTSD